MSKTKLSKDEKAVQKLNDFIKENKIVLTPYIIFPDYIKKKAPFLLKIAIKIVEKHNPKYNLDCRVQK